MYPIARTSVCLLLFIACILFGAAAVVADTDYSGNPPNAKTGAPGEGLCTQCHSGSANSGDGSFQISVAPSIYVPNQVYTVTVTLADPGQSRWGFELTALDGTEATSEKSGDFTITDAANTQLDHDAGFNRDYVKQTSTGTYNGTSNGPVSWEVQWTAPSDAVEPVTFYAAGNAANGGGTSGDFIYTTELAMQIAPPVPSSNPFGFALLALLLAGVSVFIMRARAATTN